MKITKCLALLLLGTSLASCYVFYPRKGGLRYDPIEDDPRYTRIFAEVDEKIEKRGLCEDVKKELGGVHCYWGVRKNILKTEYGVEWKSPAELNPGVIIE